MEQNVETWAYLTLMYRDFENVNFVFKSYPTVGDKRAMVMYWFLGLLMFGPLIVRADPPAFDTLSVLRFNAVCAHCHEGECSGCLSFALGPEAVW